MSNQASSTQSATAKPNIMLVDDDKFLLDMYALKFTQAGFNVHAALSSADALKALREGFKADVILFDIIMPEGDGFFLLDTLKEEKLVPDAAKIALTNEMNEDEQKKITELGATRFIVKATMIPSEVVNSVTEVIRKK